MIPLKLQLKNFLSYGPVMQTIDFTPYHLICLAGKNGHGKSALLDALTWAVWGQARKSGASPKADEGLLRLGQTQMLVSLDFSCNGNMYRVRRDYTVSAGKGIAHADFGILDPSTGNFKALTDKTIRTTQEKIDQVIGLTYDSFVNSVFLRQGNSNEFSKKSPKDRKEILATILGLDHYESLRKRSLDRARQATLERENLITLYERLTAQLNQEGTSIEQLKEVKHKLAHITDQEKYIHDQVARYEQERKLLGEQQQQCSILSIQQDQLTRQIHEHRQVLRDKVEQWRFVLRQQRIYTDYDKLGHEKKELERELVRIQEQTTQRLELRERYIVAKEQEQRCVQHQAVKHNQLMQSHDQQCATREINLQTIQAQLVEHINHNYELEQEYRATQEQHETQAAKLKHYATYDTTLKELEKEFERRKMFYHKFITRGNHLKTELKNLAHKKKLAGDGQRPSCPLCEQHLSHEHKRLLESKFHEQESFFVHQLTRLGSVIKKLKSLLIDQHEHINHIKNKREERNRLVIMSDELEKKLVRLSTLIAEHEIKKSALEHLVSEAQAALTQATHMRDEQVHAHEHFLAENIELRQLQEQAMQYDMQLATLVYNMEHHTNITQRLASISQQLTVASEIVQQSILQQQRKKEIHEHCNMLKSLKIVQKNLERELLMYSNLDRKLYLIEQQQVELAQHLKTLVKEKEVLVRETGSLEQQIRMFEQHTQEAQDYSKRMSELEIIATEYQAIAQALGKDGIQGLLIEDAIPEIEQEANALLSKLTDNQAHLMIESLRDLKSGGTKETLDIKISDALGIRPYELFSGGEAFRIDFALRIALSKLLARRGGTSLQMLIIDEGFGSQDEEGLSHIMDALHKIQDDFAKIIIVSHLQNMKEQFPVQLLVHKGPNGSLVRIVEQG